MNINEATMKHFLEDDIFKQLEKDSKAIKKRFEQVCEIFKKIDEVKDISFEGDFPIWDEKKEELNTSKRIKRAIFAPSENKIGLTRDKRFIGIENQAEYFKKLKDKEGFEWLKEFATKEEDIGGFIIKFLSIIGGFEFGTSKAKDQYRILSNARTKANDYGATLSSSTQAAWINSHFSDNTLFIEFVDFIKSCKKGEVKEEKYKNIALCHPTKGEKIEGKLSGEKRKNWDENVEDWEETKMQRGILKARFPLKFLYMWAKQERVIHPLSLMSFREFLKSEFMGKIFEELKTKEKTNKDLKAESLTNAEIAKFAEEWQKISDKIMEELGFKKEDNQYKPEDIQKVSKLISFLTLAETDTTNTKEMFETNKQIVLA